MKKFVIYWRDGTINHVEGATVNQAFADAGYGPGAINAVDFYKESTSTDPIYDWDADKKQWIQRKVKITGSESKKPLTAPKVAETIDRIFPEDSVFRIPKDKLIVETDQSEKKEKKS